jgi:hypothetical protein
MCERSEKTVDGKKGKVLCSFNDSGSDNVVTHVDIFLT